MIVAELKTSANIVYQHIYLSWKLSLKASPNRFVASGISSGCNEA